MRFDGTSVLVRLVVRRDRVRLPLWLLGIGTFVFVSARSVVGLYPTPASRTLAAAMRRENRAVLAMSGPSVALDTLGGLTVFEVGAFGFAVVALMNVLLVARHTRGEEERGTTDLLRSLAVAPWSPFAAVLLVAVAADAVLGALVVLACSTAGLPVTGSVAYGAALATSGLCFAGITLVIAQVTTHTRAVNGGGAAVIAVAFVLRAVGDVGGGPWSWCSPIGWGQAVRPFGDERWWVLALLLGSAGTCAIVAAAVAQRRDVGAGLFPPRRGPAHAGRALPHPAALALRLLRGALVGWSVGLFLAGLVYGAVAQDIDEYVASTPAIADFLGPGADLVEVYFGTVLLWLALVGSAFAVQAVLRLRTEETAGHAEAVLATAVSRRRYAAGTITVALGGSALLTVLAGAGTGLAASLTSDRPWAVVDLGLAALVDVPGVWVLAGVAMLAVGVVPRAAVGAWAAMVVALVIGLFAEVLDLPQVVRDLSPFEHLARAPAEHVTTGPILLVLGAAAALLVAGVEGYARRDIG